MRTMLLIFLMLCIPVALATKPPPEPPKQNEQVQGQVQGQTQGQVQGQEQSASSTANSESNASSESASSASTGASSSSANNEIVFAAARTRNNTPSVSIGSLFPSAVCMGVINAGLSIPGGSLGGGKSYRDDECDKRETARSFAALGYTHEALIVLCSTEAARVLATCPLPTPVVAPPVVEQPSCATKCEVEREAKVIEQKKQVTDGGK